MGHHYVPQHYLRGFEVRDEPGAIWAYDKVLHRFAKVPIKTIAQEAEFYDAQVERELSERLEGPAQKCLAKLRSRQALSSSERLLVAAYVATMMMRVPKQRAKALKIVPSALKGTIDDARALIHEWAKGSDADQALVAHRLAEVDRLEGEWAQSPLYPVASAAIQLIRHSLLEGYPLRGGVGAGSFTHETSGVRATEVIWSTCSFMGASVVSAYQASSTRSAPGLRVLVHPSVMRRNVEPFLEVLTVPLFPDEQCDSASHELRCFAPREVGSAVERLKAMQARPTVPESSLRHYLGSIRSVERLSEFNKLFPVREPGMSPVA